MANRTLPRCDADILVSDIGLPDMDGYDLMQQMRRMELKHCGAIPAIALTAFARSEDRTRALRSGFELHLAKPVDPAELVASVARLARRARARQGEA